MLFSVVQWNKYFHSVKDEMFYSTRLCLVERNISSFTSWKYLYHCTHKYSLFVYYFWLTNIKKNKRPKYIIVCVCMSSCSIFKKVVHCCFCINKIEHKKNIAHSSLFMYSYHIISYLFPSLKNNKNTIHISNTNKMEDVKQKVWSLKLGYTTFTRINLHSIKQTENQNKTKTGHAKKKNKNKNNNNNNNNNKNNISGRIIFLLNSESNWAIPPGKYPKLQVK